MSPVDPLLQEVLDEHQLRKLVGSYCRAVDRGDLDGVRDLYHHDASDAHGAFSVGSIDDFIGGLAVARPHLRSMQHHLTTMNFAISGDTAEGEIYGIAIHTLISGARDVDVIVGGRYLDEYARRDGSWKFVRRAIVTDWARVDDPSLTRFDHPITRDTPRGSPDASDPSHQFFSLLRGDVGGT